MLFGSVQELKIGDLYRITTGSDYFFAWPDNAFIPMWNDHRGGLQERLATLDSKKHNAPVLLYCGPKEMLLYCGPKEGYTPGDGNGKYYQFLKQESVIYLSFSQLSGVHFSAITDF